MKTVTYVMTMVALALPVTMAAQPSAIKIRQGESVDYNVSAEIEMTELVGDREEMLRAETGGVAQLKARRVSRQKIEWSYETPEVKLIRVSSQMEPGMTEEKTVQTPAGRFSTDAKGRVVSSAKGSKESASLTTMMEAMHRSLVKLWFQPQIFRRMKPGDRWSEKREENIRVDDMGIDVDMSYAVNYTFDGIVDTLGMKAIRVSWRADQMTIDGKRTLDGVSAPVQGDGEHFGTTYFSTIDGLMLASVSENTVDIRVTPDDAGGRIIPMMWRMRSESIRR